VRKLFAVLLLALTVRANDVTVHTMQSGTPSGPLTIHNRGLHGEGQIVAVLDTGVEYTSCYFREPDNSPPPFNTGTPSGGLNWQNIDLSRRKIIAYNFLYSCAQYPSAPGCDMPGNLGALHNQRHGTHAAGTAVGDKGAPLVHDFADSIAPGAKLIVQDGGYINGDFCTQFPGVGCPAKLTPILEQAYKQGARIHSNSWGDRQGNPFSPPTANYPQSAYDVDTFLWLHPDMLMVFNTGNLGQPPPTPRSSLSAPGSAKNTIQVGGARNDWDDDDTISYFTLFGPARDGRIKPDLVAPARVIAADINLDQNANTCDATDQPGTSWASPSVAGAAALVRQYYTDGFYPSGAAASSNTFTPSAALLKATLIAAARPLLWRKDVLTNSRVAALPVPSIEQGWGFPVLDESLYFTGDTKKLRVVDVPLASGLTAGAASTIRVDVRPGTPLKAVLVWTDPPGTIRNSIADTTPQLVNDLDLRIRTGAATYYGNGGDAPDRLNNVEVVSIATPDALTAEITITTNRLGFGDRQSYALVLTGDIADVQPSAPARRRAARH
jgi:subtilase family protein